MVEQAAQAEGVIVVARVALGGSWAAEVARVETGAMVAGLEDSATPAEEAAPKVPPSADDDYDWVPTASVGAAPVMKTLPTEAMDVSEAQ